MKKTYIAKGNTYDVKEKLNKMGAKWRNNNWTFDALPTEKIEGITFETVIRISDENEIEKSIEILKKEYMPTAIEGLEKLVEMNRGKYTAEELIENGGCAQHQRFAVYAKEHLEVNRLDFNNYKEHLAFNKIVEEKIKNASIKENFWK